MSSSGTGHHRQRSRQLRRHHHGFASRGRDLHGPLSDAEYIPNAIFDSPSSGNLNEGFTDLTGGAFQTCADLNDCNNDTANWALDVTTRGKVHNTVIEEANVRGMPCR